MNRFFRTLTCLLLLLTCAIGSSHAATDENGKRFVYLASLEIGSGTDLPIDSVAELWVPNRAYETAPGSNVYEITKDLSKLSWGRWIRFFSDLATDIPEGYDWQSFHMNLIQPACGHDITLTPLPNGVIYTTEVTEKKFSESVGCFELPTEGIYRLILDLNNHSLTAIPQDTYLAVVNEKLDITRLHTYPAFGSIAAHYPAGDLSFGIYSAFDNTWQIPKTAEMATLTPGENLNIRTKKGESDPEELYKVTDWTGGVIIGQYFYISSGTGYGKISILPDNIEYPLDKDRILVQTPWQSFTPDNTSSNAAISCFPALTPDGNGSYTGSLYIPAGCFKLRFINALDAAGDLTLIAPPGGTDRELVADKGVAYSSAELLKEDAAGYWTYYPDMKWPGGDVQITVTPGGRTMVKFEWSSTDDPNINLLYVIGTPNNWNITESSIILQPTDKGGYYGSFDAPEGDVMFRFYSALGNWESGSLGSQYDDAVGDYWDPLTSDVHKADCIPGKGNYEITAWPGGTVYVYADITAQRVTFSSKPITSAGEIINPADVKHFYVYSCGKYVELKKNTNGLYVNEIGSSEYKGTLDLRIFTKKLPISTEEPEWGGSYSLVPTVTDPVELDEYNVAEFGFTVKDDVFTDGGTPFRVAAGGDNFWYSIAIDPENSKLYVERLDHQIILFGDNTGGEIPSYSTRNNFRNAIISTAGAPVELPAGNPKITASRSLAQVPATLPDLKVHQATLTDGFVDISNYYGSSVLYDKYVEVPDWKGGKLFITLRSMFDPSAMDKLVAAKCTKGEWTYDTIMPTRPGSGIFKGEMNIDGESTIQFERTLGEYPQFVISSIAHLQGTGSIKPVYDGYQNLVAGNGEVSAKIGLYGISFSFPALVGAVELEYTLDLNEGTFSASLPEDCEGNIYEIVADNDSSLDGAVAYPSQKTENAVVVTAAADNTGFTEDRTVDFNFTSPDGSSIYPSEETDTKITFDENGVWKGTYTARKSMAKSRAAARRAASSLSAWQIDIPAGKESRLAIMLDEATSTITVTSSAHNEGFFIIDSTDVYNNANSIEDIEVMKQNMLHPVADMEGVYEGYLHLDASEEAQKHTLIIARGIDGYEGLLPLFFDQSLSVLEKDDVQTMLASEQTYGYYIDLLTSFDTIKFRYDSNEVMLTASYDPSGVEQIQPEEAAEGLNIYPCEGGIRVVSADETVIAVYTLTGQAAAYCKVLPGTTEIRLPAGFYIAAGRKILVR